jgi:hypothetical protein
MSRTAIFYGAALASFVFALLSMAMRESRPSQVLHQGIKSISRNTGFKSLSMDAKSHPPTTLKSFVRDSLTVPSRLFFTEPIVFWTSVMAATITISNSDPFQLLFN